MEVNARLESQKATQIQEDPVRQSMQLNKKAVIGGKDNDLRQSGFSVQRVNNSQLPVASSVQFKVVSYDK
jgi:hypothetical protein